LYVAGGRVRTFEKADAIPELQQGQLLSLVERWLRQEQQERLAAEAAEDMQAGQQAGGKGQDMPQLASWNNGWAAGRLASSIKHASNAVMRM
jgi:hypothetical protein